MIKENVKKGFRVKISQWNFDFYQFLSKKRKKAKFTEESKCIWLNYKQYMSKKFSEIVCKGVKGAKNLFHPCFCVLSTGFGFWRNNHSPRP